MKLYCILGGILLVSSSAFAAPCLTGTLQDYVNLGTVGCQNGVVTFSGFVTAPGQNGATVIPLTQVLVNPGGGQFMPTFQFTLNQTANPGQLFESFFRFKASNSQLIGAKVGLNSPIATGDGAVTASLDICPGALFSGNSPTGCANSVSLISVATSGFSMPTDSASFPISSFFDVFTDLSVDGGLGGGSARFNSASVTIQATPEPSAQQLMLAGLAMLTLFGIRRNTLTGGNNESN